MGYAYSDRVTFYGEREASWVGQTLSGEALNRTGSSSRKRFKGGEGFGIGRVSIAGFEDGGAVGQGILRASRS